MLILQKKKKKTAIASVVVKPLMLLIISFNSRKAEQRVQNYRKQLKLLPIPKP